MKPIVSVLVAALALVGLTGCFALESRTAPRAAEFTSQAVAKGSFIIAISEIAASRSRREDLRRFATVATDVQRDFVAGLLATSHPREQLQFSRLSMPTEAQQRVIEQLMTTSGEEFDQVYLQHLRPAYEDAVAQLSALVRLHGNGDPLMIPAMLSKMQHHLTHIRGFTAPLIG
jgi:predicted outer membrane protein